MKSIKQSSSRKYPFSFLLVLAITISAIGFMSLAAKPEGVQAAGSPFIYDNGGLATGAVSNSGVNAPAGTQWSEVQNETGNTTYSNTLAGVSCSVTATVFRCADDFTVPAGQTWTVDQVAVFAYQTNLAGTTSPITAATLQIWNGRPGDAGSTVIFGDTTTNRLATSTDSLLWRIFNSAVPAPGTTPATNRRLWDTRINVAPAQVLSAGTYWISWNTQIGATTAHFTPPVTIPGTRGLPGWNARQFTTTGWQNVIDVGNPDVAAPDIPMDFPFKLVGSISGGATPQKPNVDFDGDGESDFSIVRDETPGLAGSQSVNGLEAGRLRMQKLAESRGEYNSPEGEAGNSIVWYIHNSDNGTASISAFGTAATDLIVPADFDGDDRADIAVWRATGPTSASFFIFESSTSTLREEVFGQQGDNPQVSADYDGDGRADVATFRCPPAGGQCYFFYRGSDNNPAGNITYVPWGNGTPFQLFPNVGDFDGDGRADFCLQRENPDAAGQGQFVLLRSSDFGVEYINWGLANDFIVPGDYDGDGRSDFMVRRIGSNPYQWFLLTRDGGGTGASPIFWGIPGDIMTPGDYDGDGSTDISVWRPNADPDANFFFIRRSSDAGLSIFEWGVQNDVPTANWIVQ